MRGDLTVKIPRVPFPWGLVLFAVLSRFFLKEIYLHQLTLLGSNFIATGRSRLTDPIHMNPPPFHNP